jgi:hypothetical protein
MNSPEAPQVLGSAPLVARSDADGIATLTLNRPAQFNALSGELLDALQDALDAVAPDPSIRVVVIAGAGRAFCAGHDLKEMLANDRGVRRRPFRRCCEVMLQPAFPAGDRAYTASRRRRLPAMPLAISRSPRPTQLRHLGDQFRLVLCDTAGAACAQCRPQAGVRDDFHRRIHRCANRACVGIGEPMSIAELVRIAAAGPVDHGKPADVVADAKALPPDRTRHRRRVPR